MNPLGYDVAGIPKMVLEPTDVRLEFLRLEALVVATSRRNIPIRVEMLAAATLVGGAINKSVPNRRIRNF